MSGTSVKVSLGKELQVEPSRRTRQYQLVLKSFLGLEIYYSI